MILPNCTENCGRRTDTGGVCRVCNVGFPNKKYKIIYADPPWSYSNKVTGNHGGAGAVNHYNTMSLSDVKKLPIKQIRNKDSVLFLWAVNPLLPEALEVMKAWGFNYKTTVTWVKPRTGLNQGGLGNWFRGYTEFLLMGVCGNQKAFGCQKNNYIIQENLGHSKKPDSFRKLIENATNDLKPRIELFARTRVHGWDTWGNDEKLKAQPLEAFLNA